MNIMTEMNQQLESIASHVAKAFGSFRDLEEALSQTAGFCYSPEGTALTDLLSKTQNDFTRFKMWVGNQAAHQSGPASLDHRLREAPHLQQQVIYLLKDISQSLQDAISIALDRPSFSDQDQGIEKEQDIHDDAIFLDSDGEKDNESNFSDSDLDSDTSPDAGLSTLFIDVGEAIDCLLRLSVAIANPAPHERFRKLDAGIPEDVSFYEPHDIAYVKDKFPKADDQLANALGKFITRRRQFFKYRRAHHEKLASGIDSVLSNKETDTSRTEFVPMTVASSLPEQFKSQTDPQAAVIDEDIRSDTGMSQTSYATSVGFPIEGTDEEMQKPAPSIRIPPRPNDSENGIFECPFCYRMISAKTRAAWKRHVFGDLRPYTCILSHCSESNMDFDRRHDWQLHVSKCHWRSWSCPLKCQKSFTSAAELSSHVKDHHLSSGIKEEVIALTALGEGSAPEDIPRFCLLCGHSETKLKKYIKHVGRHLEQLALFALPSLEKDFLEEEHESHKQNSAKSEIDANSSQGSSIIPSPILAVKQLTSPGLRPDEKRRPSFDDYKDTINLHGLSENALGKQPAMHDPRSEKSEGIETQSQFATTDALPDEQRTMITSTGPEDEELAVLDATKSQGQAEAGDELGTAESNVAGQPEFYGESSKDEYLRQSTGEIVTPMFRGDVSSDWGGFFQKQSEEVVTITETDSEAEQPDSTANAKQRFKGHHQCDECPKTFSRAEHLRRHKLSHSPPDKKCPMCTRVFFRQDLLERHISKHIEEERWLLEREQQYACGLDNAHQPWTESPMTWARASTQSFPHVAYTSTGRSETEGTSLHTPPDAGVSDTKTGHSPPRTPVLQNKNENFTGPPTCSNCFTQITPLWRRGPDGKPLCNACGLFLELHGVKRQGSLKSDANVKRNRGSGSGSGYATETVSRDPYNHVVGTVEENPQLKADDKRKPKNDDRNVEVIAGPTSAKDSPSEWEWLTMSL